MTQPPLEKLIAEISDVEEKARDHCKLPYLNDDDDITIRVVRLAAFKAGAESQRPIREALGEALIAISICSGSCGVNEEKIRAILQGETNEKPE